MDVENYKSETIGIKQISLDQYRRCVTEGSKNILIDPIQREIYFNSIGQMEIILMPEIEREKKIKQQMKDNDEKITLLKKEFNDTIKDLQTRTPVNQQINMNKINNYYERKLIILYNEKLIILSRLLKILNYYEEEAGYIE